MTARGTWKAVERRGASLFGTLRNRCSGSGGRPDESTSDSRHETLYIETKLRASPSVWSLWDSCKAKCKGPDKDKVPVILVAKKHHHGFLIVCHSSDMGEVCDAWRKAQQSKEEEEV